MKWNGSTNVQSFNVVSSEMVRTNKFQISVRTSLSLYLLRKMKNVRRDRMRGTIKRNRNKTVILDSTHNPSRTPCFSVSWEPSNFWDGMEWKQISITSTFHPPYPHCSQFGAKYNTMDTKDSATRTSTCTRTRT
jgi:hypothetical protein